MTDLSPQKRAAMSLLSEGEEYVFLFFRKAKGLDIFFPLKDSGWFLADKNPAPIKHATEDVYTIPRWPVLDYLEKVAIESALPENKVYAAALMQIIRDVTRPLNAKKVDNTTTWWSFSKMISALPTDVIQLDDIELIADWLDTRFPQANLVGTEIGESFLPKLLISDGVHDISLATRVVDVATRIKWVDIRTGDNETKKEPTTSIDPYWLNELFKGSNNAKKLGEKCGSSVIELLRSRLSEASRDLDHVSYIWRPAIEDHPQNHSDTRDIKSILLSALREAFLGFAERNPEQFRDYVRLLFSDKSQVAARLAIYLSDRRFDVLNQVFAQAFESKLLSAPFRHEMYSLLANHFQDCSEPEKSRLLDAIDSLEASWAEQDVKVVATASLRLGWFSALKNSGNDRALLLHSKYLSVTGREPTHPDFSFYMETRWGGSKSPYSVEELLSKDIGGIINLINSYKNEHDLINGRVGLKNAIQEAVKRNPSLFVTKPSELINLNIDYIDSVFDAFKDLWVSGSELEWKEILEFSLLLLDSLPGPEYPTHVFSSLSDLIAEGVKSDEKAFLPKYLPTAERAIVKMLEMLPSAPDFDKSDAVTQAINTPKGRCVEALIYYSLRCARLQDQATHEHQNVWKSLEPIFDRELGLSNRGNYEFSTLCGMYLPNLYYLSTNWVQTNVDRIFSLASEANWNCAMQGYCYVSTVYSDIFNLLKEHGHFVKVLEEVHGQESVRNHIIEHVTLAFLHGFESYESKDSLFARVIEIWKQEDIKHIIWFLSVQKDLGPKLQQNVLMFWDICYTKIKGHEKEHELLLSELSLLAPYLKNVNQNQLPWLLQCAPFAELKYHGHQLVEYLDELANRQPVEAAKVCLSMLSGTIPYHPRAKIRSLTEKLYTSGTAEAADAICNKYYLSGDDLLKDIYDRYRHH
jgi:hypothetical protein